MNSLPTPRTTLRARFRNLGLPVVGGISILGQPPFVHRLLIAPRA